MSFRDKLAEYEQKRSELIAIRDAIIEEKIAKYKAKLELEPQPAITKLDEAMIHLRALAEYEDDEDDGIEESADADIPEIDTSAHDVNAHAIATDTSTKIYSGRPGMADIASPLRR